MKLKSQTELVNFFLEKAEKLEPEFGWADPEDLYEMALILSIMRIRKLIEEVKDKVEKSILQDLILESEERQ